MRRHQETLNTNCPVKEASLKRPHTYYIIPTIRHSGKSKAMETGKRSVFSRGSEESGRMTRQSTEGL